ncbi:phage minor tail protein [Acetobacter senegalensis]|uniref:Phage minor tail protein n=1 Tax=Acetobacter senegalensis TaxID=446692 RepID=A0A0U5B8C7_9PROT|nr:phage tail tube protein [Acetobacter senegalensis]CEF40789.1 phage minor tail protein [Acetobacter senegalensis]
MATGATTGYAAGEQTNTSPVDYAQEVTYNIAPAGTYQRLRLTGESLAAQDSTSTPDEINNLPEVAETVLTGRSTGGSVNGVLSYGTYDDFLAGVLGADFTSLAAITPSPGKFTVQQVDPGNGNLPTIWASNAGTSLSVFGSVPVGAYVRILDPANNIDLYAVVIGKNAGSTLIFQAGALSAIGSISPSASMSIIYNGVTNSGLGKTYTIRKKLAGEWQVFTGNMVNQVQIQLQKGQVPTVQIDFIGSDMTVTTVDVSSAVNAATTSPLMDVVGGFLGCSIFGQSPAGCIQSATITLARDGSGQDTGMGHVGACGIQFGALKASMDIEYFFKDYTEFLAWQAGQKGQVSVSIKGSDGYGYQFTLLNGRIFNPKNPISGKNATIVTTISVTGNPLPGGGTFAITRITPTS